MFCFCVVVVVVRVLRYNLLFLVLWVMLGESCWWWWCLCSGVLRLLVFLLR